MLLFKLILGVSILLLLLKIAKNKCQSKKEISEFYYDLYMLCEDFYAEMLYKKTPLEIFLKKRNEKKLLGQVIDSYLKGEINKTLFSKEFTQSEIDKIISFFSSLGSANTQSQINLALSYKEGFLKAYNDKKEIFNKYSGLYIKVSFSVGLMAMVVVL